MPNARPLAAAVALACAQLALAHAAVAAPPPTAVAPPPEACIAEPRSAADLDRLLAGPEATPVAVARIPAGDIAPERTVAAMSETLHGYLACVNADDPARAYALLTDAAILRLNAVVKVSAAPDATPVLGADVDLAEIVLTDGARQFEDGRAGLYATIRFPEGVQPERWFFTFARDGVSGAWLIDGVAGSAPFPLP